MKIMLLNAGSSSLKASVLDTDDTSIVARGQSDWKGSHARYEFARQDGMIEVVEEVEAGYASAVRRFVNDWRRADTSSSSTSPTPAAIGHRVVHGGQFTSSVRITPDVRTRIAELADLAPLHNPPSLETLAAAEFELPNVPQIAIFDTAFHATIPPEAYTYAVPDEWTNDWGIRRYGFHGLSHAYCAHRAAELLGRPEEGLRLVICHLGHGCSATAVHNGRSVDTTMGYTPLEGLMMATRSGSVDPGALLFVQQRHGLTPDIMEATLNRSSGLLGVSGTSSDLRIVLDAARTGDKRSRLAIGIYTHRIRQAIGSLTATLGGIDALVFTAGVGEHSAEIRASVTDGLEYLGLKLDLEANESCQLDADVATESSTGRILVIKTREDLTMLREVVGVLQGDNSANSESDI